MGEKFFRNVLGNLIIGVVVVAVFLVAFGDGVVRVSSQKLTPVYSGRSSDKISLMVNVYWGTEYLPDMLDAFDEYGVKTTFFVGGVWANKNDSMLQEIYNRGHEIGNHGYFHKDQVKISRQANYDEIHVTHELVRKILGVEMTLFAPPSGAFSQTTLEVAKEHAYQTVMWTRDTVDWRDKDVKIVYNRAVKDAKGGDFVLMHPTKHTAAALRDILKTLGEKGLTVSTVSRTLLSDT